MNMPRISQQLLLLALTAGAIAAQTAPLTIGAGPLPEACATEAWLYRLSATGGSPPYTWGLSGTPLPSGLTLEGVNGVLSGTPVTGGSYPVTVHVLDSKGVTLERKYDLIVTSRFVLAPKAPSDGTTGVTYREFLGASGGTPPYDYGVTSGNLPSGLILNSASGVISGLPAAQGTFQFSLTARDSALRALTVPLSIRIASPATPPPAVSYPLAPGYVGEPYTTDLGTYDPGVSAAATGLLPPGLEVTAKVVTQIFTNTQTVPAMQIYTSYVRVTGEPKTEGVFSFGVTVTPGGTHRDYTIAILPKRGPPVFTPSLQRARVGHAYSALMVSQGRTPLQFAIPSGKLPDGIAIDTRTSALSGTPRYPGDYAFTFSVTDITGAVFTQDYRLSVLPYEIGAGDIVSAASYTSGPVSPGEIVAVFGADLGPAIVASQTINDRGLFGTTLAGTRVLFGGVPSPLLFTSYGQVGAIVPYGLAGTKTVRLEMEYNGIRTNSVELPVADVTPAIFTANSTGKGPGLMLNQDYTVNAKSNPASRGSIIILYVTGLGLLDTPTADGAVAGNAALHQAAVTARIGGTNAEVLYAGSAPGSVAGLSQVNVRVPSDTQTGDSMPIMLTALGIPSQDGVTVSVK
jgi:uncharacterized protein (TIGR03437 family)